MGEVYPPVNGEKL